MSLILASFLRESADTFESGLIVRWIGYMERLLPDEKVLHKRIRADLCAKDTAEDRKTLKLSIS